MNQSSEFATSREDAAQAWQQFVELHTELYSGTAPEMLAIGKYTLAGIPLPGIPYRLTSAEFAIADPDNTGELCYSLDLAIGNSSVVSLMYRANEQGNFDAWIGGDESEEPLDPQDILRAIGDFSAWEAQGIVAKATPENQ